MNDPYRLTARLISRRVLRQHMKHRRIPSGYALAKAAGILPGTVNNLLRDRNSCSPETAAAIEHALDVPSESLFLLKRVRVADTLHRAA